MPSIAVRRTAPHPSAPSAATSRHEEQQSQPSPSASASPDCCAYCGRGSSSESSLHLKTALDEQNGRIAELIRKLGDKDRRIAELERAVAAAEDAEAEAEAKLEAFTGGIGVAPPAARESFPSPSSTSSSVASYPQAASGESAISSSAYAPSFSAWGDRFEQLRQFHVRHGHLRVPRSTKLWTWVNTQRLEYRRVIARRQQQQLSHDTSKTAMDRGVTSMSSGSNNPLDRPCKLTPDQIIALDSINFKSVLNDFSEGSAKKAAKIAVAKESKWDLRIEQCKAFKAKHGHLWVTEKANKKFALWSAGIKREYKKWKAGEPSKLTDEQRAELDGLGFVWDGAAFLAEQTRRRWEAMLAEFVRFKDEHGSGWESKFTQSSHPKLYGWVSSQRSEYRKRERGDQSNMTDDKVSKLEAAGFEWERQYAEDSDSDSDSGEDDGMEIEGSEGNGTGKGKSKSKDEGEGEGVVFSAPGNYEHTADPAVAKRCNLLWESKYQQLKAFKEAHGHLDLPNNSQYKTLRGWAFAAQRAEYRKWKAGERTAFTEERRLALESIGFDLAPEKNGNQKKIEEADRRWWANLEGLRKYREENNGSIEGMSESCPIFPWMRDQRKYYKQWKRGEQSPINEQRKAALDELGFDWDPVSKQDVLIQRAWDEKFELLRDFKRVNGHLSVPYLNNLTLYGWIKKQRQHYAEAEMGLKSPLTQDRRARLEELGFTWEQPLTQEQIRRERDWQDNLDKLRAYKASHGTSDVTPEIGSSLYGWVQSQRKAYKQYQRGERSSMTEKRKLALEKLGFDWKLEGRWGQGSS